MLLDVTLRRDGEVRRWTINQPMLDEGSTCRRVTTQSVTMSGCTTKEEVMAKVREWQLRMRRQRPTAGLETISRASPAVPFQGVGYVER